MDGPLVSANVILLCNLQHRANLEPIYTAPDKFLNERIFYPRILTTSLQFAVLFAVQKHTPIPHFSYAPYCPPPPQILHNLCFSFLLGFTAVLRWLEPVFLWGYHPTLKLSGIPTLTSIVSLTHRMDNI